MEHEKEKRYRAVNFDLSDAKLKEYYSKKNPKGAYGKILRYFKEHNFEHRQYSGYRSKEKMSDVEIMDLMNDLFEQLPWIEKVAEKIDVTNVGKLYDILRLYNQQDIDRGEMVIKTLDKQYS